MDDLLTTLEHHVAEAAQAWLDDPRDTAVYSRLVAAVEARRQYLGAPLVTADRVPADRVPADPGPVEPAPVELVDAEQVTAESHDEELTVVRAVGDVLAGDPEEVLRRLRGVR